MPSSDMDKVSGSVISGPEQGKVSQEYHLVPHLASGGDVVPHGQPPATDFLISVEGDVPLQHVIEEHPQGPHGARQS